AHQAVRCRAVVGAARDVLSDDRHAETLHARGVLYAPACLAAGGALAGLAGDDDEMAVQERIAEIGPRLRRLWDRARHEGVSPLEAVLRQLGRAQPREVTP